MACGFHIDHLVAFQSGSAFVDLHDSSRSSVITLILGLEGVSTLWRMSQEILSILGGFHSDSGYPQWMWEVLRAASGVGTDRSKGRM